MVVRPLSGSFDAPSVADAPLRLLKMTVIGSFYRKELAGTSGEKRHMRMTLDKFGRIVLPKSIRDELRLEPGDALEIGSSGGNIILRPLRRETQLRKKNGVWVCHTGEPLSARTVKKTSRLEQILGCYSPYPQWRNQA